MDIKGKAGTKIFQMGPEPAGTLECVELAADGAWIDAIAIT